MTRSESVAKLTVALSKVQGEIPGIRATGKNSFFGGKDGSTYFTLDDILPPLRAALNTHGIYLMQHTDDEDYLVTTLYLGDEFLSTRTKMVYDKQNMQGRGSAMTYARRYSLLGLFSISDVDDDGNAASGKEAKGKESKDFTFKFGLEESKELASSAEKAGLSSEAVMNLYKVLFKKSFKKDLVTESEYLQWINEIFKKIPQAEWEEETSKMGPISPLM